MNSSLVAGIVTMLATASPKVVARLAPVIIPADTSTFTFAVELSAEARQRLQTIDSEHEIMLDLDDIEAERSPAAYFEIYIHAKGTPRGRSVGNLALFGTGIRSETHGAFRAAHVQLAVTDEMRRALEASRTIALTFVAQGAGGGPEPRSASTVAICRLSILIAPRLRDAVRRRE